MSIGENDSKSKDINNIKPLTVVRTSHPTIYERNLNIIRNTNPRYKRLLSNTHRCFFLNSFIEKVEKLDSKNISDCL